MKTILVTGAAGFIGCRFLEQMREGEEANIVVLDSLTYAGDTARWEGADATGAFVFRRGDVADADLVEGLFAEHGFDAVVHFAAESHVDRSIESASPFIRANVQGTQVLLDAARKHKTGRFLHVSTDEVYGELGEEGVFVEETPFRPNSPYSASKAAGDMLVQAYRHTHGMDTVIVRPSNNYGPWQYPEKLVPVVISRALDDRSVPVYAQGLNVREWLFVDDCSEGIGAVLEKGRAGEAYNIGSGEERRNIDVVKGILGLLGKPESLITFVEDRPGHDFRYRLDSGKAERELGWRARTKFEAGLEATVRWYVDHQEWWRGHLKA